MTESLEIMDQAVKAIDQMLTTDDVSAWGRQSIKIKYIIKLNY